MKFYIAIVLFSCLALNVSAIEDEWNLFKLKYNKKYLNADEEASRKVIFERNKILVAKINSNKPGTAKLNHLSDLEASELGNGLQQAKRILRDNRNSAQAQAFLDKILNSNATIPREVDWRKVPERVGKVRQRATCRVTSKIIAVGLLESQMTIRVANLSKIIDLSIQQLVDCNSMGLGCQGSTIETDLISVIQKHGIESEADYPFKDRFQRCKFDLNKSVMSITDMASLPMFNRSPMLKTVALYGPIAVDFGIEDEVEFQHWTDNRVYSCKKPISVFNIGHGALLVGYGTDPVDGDYWILQYNVGTSWGNGGYFRMTRDNFHDCGIRIYPTIATF